MKAAAFFKQAIVLIGLSALAYFFHMLLGKHFLFKTTLLGSSFWIRSLGSLPLICILIAFINNLNIQEKARQWIVALSYVFIFFFLAQDLTFSLTIIHTVAALYFLNEFLPYGKIFTFLFFCLSSVLLYFPLVYYKSAIPLEGIDRIFIIIYKSCLSMRIISWIIDRRIYKRKDHGFLNDLLEFIFCPIFFIFPGQIQYFLYQYFHKSKQSLTETKDHLHSLWLGLWGLILMSLFSYMNAFFWKGLVFLPLTLSGANLIFYHFLMGIFWLVGVYFQQAGGMSFQVSLGRILGYQIKYDMHWPLLARTPLDYLRRHSSYVRDYIVEAGLRPLSLPLLRMSIDPNVVFPFAAIVSYAFFILPQTGIRPDYDRSWASSLMLLLFLVIYVTLPPIFKYLFKKKNDFLTSNIDHLPLSQWKLKDYVSWISTLCLLALSKTLVSLAMSW